MIGWVDQLRIKPSQPCLSNKKYQTRLISIESQPKKIVVVVVVVIGVVVVVVVVHVIVVADNIIFSCGQKY